MFNLSGILSDWNLFQLKTLSDNQTISFNILTYKVNL